MPYQVKHIKRKTGTVEWKVICNRAGIPMEFPSRRKARSFLKNHRYAFSERPTIVHPDGHCEEFSGTFVGDEK